MSKLFTRTSRFNKIYIIDTPPQPNEERSGVELYRWLRNRVEQAGILAERIEISSKKNLVKTLHQIGDEAEQGQIFPLLHFEAHGNMKGIEITPGKVFEWESLLNLTRRINVAVKNNLLLSFAVCNAGFLYAEIDIMKPAPFHGFVSSLEKIDFGAMHAGYNAFFDNIIRSNNMNKALDVLNAFYEHESKGRRRQMFDFKLAEHFFENMWFSYLEVWKDEAHRKASITDQMLQALSNPVMRNRYSIPTLRYLVEKLNSLENKEAIKQEQRQIFMMDGS